MSEVTDLTAAVKALTNQLKGGPSRLTAAERRGEKIEDLKERNELLKKRLEIDKEIGRTAQEKAKFENENKLEQLSNTKELLRLNALEGEAKKQAIKDVKKLSDETEKYAEKTTKAIEKQSQAFKAGAAEADNLLNRFLMLSGEGKAFFSIIGNGTTSLLGFAAGLAKSVLSGDLLVKSFQKLIGNSINFAFEIDRQNAQFKAATGAGNEFSGVLDEAGSRYLTYGINAQDAGRATQALFGSFRDFTNLSESEQANIAATAATLDKFGVSAQTTGQILDQATKSLYMNSQEAELLTRQAVTLARDIGKPMTEVASDLASAAPKLAFYGKQMFEVFAQLERQAKATGLSVDSLLGLVGEKFDTFEGAGQAVGRLNAILGGPYLNSIDMLNAKEPQRLQMIKETIEAYGGQFDALNKFEQKAFASAMGTDVDTLRRMLNDLDPEVQRQALRQEQLAKKAGEARDIMTKLTDAINSLIIKNKPLMDSIVEGVDKFSELIFQLNKGEKSIFDLGKKIFGMLPLWGKLLLVVGAVSKVFSVTKGVLAGFQIAAGGFSKAAGIVKGGFTLMSSGARGFLAALGPVALLLSGIIAGYQTYKKIKEANIAGDKSGAMNAGALGGAGAGALTGAGIGLMVGGPLGAAVGGLIGGAVGALGGVGAAQVVGVDDASVPLQITKFNNQDTFERVGNSVVAAKPDGTLDKAIRESVEKQTAVLVEAIQNAMNVQVQVGDQQLGDVVVKALNSPRAKNSISPFYEG